MKKLLFLIAMFCTLKANSQNYLISFAATGSSTTVSTVKVENLTAGTNITLNGTDILRLNGPTGISPLENGKSAEMKIYPNPMNDNAVLRISPPVSGRATISVMDMAGRLISKTPVYLENQPQELIISGLKSGFYLIGVKGSDYQYSGKLLCNSHKAGAIRIDKIINNKAFEEKTINTDSKGELATVDMDYTTGDMLKITGKFEKYSTVVMDVPTSSKTITFNFIPCRDFDGNLYSVVEIGTQTWMAENLKTTHYNDGSSIPLVLDNTEWKNLATPGYCWYNNDENFFKSFYGALYNWYTVNTDKLCPIGWHVPAGTEWNTLLGYLGGFDVAGGKLKENTTWWWLPPNTGATNETGFTALPGGYRYDACSGVGTQGWYWQSGEAAPTAGAAREMTNDGSDVYGAGELKIFGFSVRCIKD